MKSASRSGPLLLCRRDEQRWPGLLLWAKRSRLPGPTRRPDFCSERPEQRGPLSAGCRITPAKRTSVPGSRRNRARESSTATERQPSPIPRRGRMSGRTAPGAGDRTSAFRGFDSRAPGLLLVVPSGILKYLDRALGGCRIRKKRQPEDHLDCDRAEPRAAPKTASSTTTPLMASSATADTSCSDSRCSRGRSRLCDATSSETIARRLGTW
jgi:hypothetical protein